MADVVRLEEVQKVAYTPAKKEKQRMFSLNLVNFPVIWKQVNDDVLGGGIFGGRAWRSNQRKKQEGYSKVAGIMPTKAVQLPREV
jgi:hypothetical protein